VPYPGCAEKIRFLDIDAPESYQPHCDAELQAGLRAKERVVGLICAGDVSIERHGKDRFGRTLGRVKTAEGVVGGILLRESLALPYEPGSKAKASRISHWCRPGEW
jgi:endonuclease YncB( thermonuclease family)